MYEYEVRKEKRNTFYITIFMILFVCFTVLCSLSIGWEHYEDGSGRVFVQYCIPSTPCEE